MRRFPADPKPRPEAGQEEREAPRRPSDKSLRRPADKALRRLSDKAS